MGCYGNGKKKGEFKAENDVVIFQRNEKIEALIQLFRINKFSVEIVFNTYFYLSNDNIGQRSDLFSNHGDCQSEIPPPGLPIAK